MRCVRFVWTCGAAAFRDAFCLYACQVLDNWSFEKLKESAPAYLEGAVRGQPVPVNLTRCLSCLTEYFLCSLLLLLADGWHPLGAESHLPQPAIRCVLCWTCWLLPAPVELFGVSRVMCPVSPRACRQAGRDLHAGLPLVPVRGPGRLCRSKHVCLTGCTFLRTSQLPARDEGC